MTSLGDSKKGQIVPIDYILIFSISTVFFGLMILTLSSVVDITSRQAINNEFTDIGNHVSSAITSAYISTPIVGETITVVDIPKEVAGEGYFIDISDENPYENDKKSVKVTSIHEDMTVHVPLSTIDKLVEINGSASSASGKIVIFTNMTSILVYQG